MIAADTAKGQTPRDDLKVVCVASCRYRRPNSTDANSHIRSLARTRTVQAHGLAALDNRHLVRPPHGWNEPNQNTSHFRYFLWSGRCVRTEPASFLAVVVDCGSRRTFDAKRPSAADDFSFFAMAHLQHTQ